MRIRFITFFFLLFALHSYAQTASDPANALIENDSIYVSPDIRPVFPGGEVAFGQFIFSNIVYPRDARKLGIEGIVIASYIVEKDGTLSNIEVVKGSGLNPSCNQTVIDVLSKSPRWKPGIKDGKPVRVKQFSQVRFSLTK